MFIKYTLVQTEDIAGNSEQNYTHLNLKQYKR